MLLFRKEALADTQQLSRPPDPHARAPTFGNLIPSIPTRASKRAQLPNLPLQLAVTNNCALRLKPNHAGVFRAQLPKKKAAPRASGHFFKVWSRCTKLLLPEDGTELHPSPSKGHWDSTHRAASDLHSGEELFAQKSPSWKESKEVGQPPEGGLHPTATAPSVTPLPQPQLLHGSLGQHTMQTGSNSNVALVLRN